MNRVDMNSLGDFLLQPWLATLATYRKDGTVLLSPVWWIWDGEAFQISVDDGDWKEKHVRRNPRISLCISEEESYPGRALEASGLVTLIADPEGEGLLRIATKYCGPEIAARYVENNPASSYWIMRIVPDKVRSVDHLDVPFLKDAVPQFPSTTP
jgi:PPOX class probable F420-dependent enzyme